MTRFFPLFLFQRVDENECEFYENGRVVFKSIDSLVFYVVYLKGLLLTFVMVLILRNLMTQSYN